MVLVTMLRSAPGSLDVLAGMADVPIQGAVVVRPWKRWLEEELSEAEVCLLDTEAVVDIVLSGSILPKIGLKVGLKMPRVVEEGELEDASAVTETLEYEEARTSLLCMGPQMGLNAK